MNELKLERVGVVGTVRFSGNISGHVVGETSQQPGVTIFVESFNGTSVEGYINHADIPQVIEYLQKCIGR